MAANWQEKRPFEETNFHMLNDNVLSDVTFLMGSDKTEVKAHRFMLASRSPVFFAMFCGELSETSGRIEIKDIEADTMKTLLRFIYTEECAVTGESVMALLYAAKKYNIKRLEEKCQTFLSETELKQKCGTKDSRFKVSKRRTGTIHVFKNHKIHRLLSEGMHEWTYSENKTDAISFSISKQVMFLGIGLYMPIKPGKLIGSASLFGMDESFIINKAVELNYDSSKRQTDVMFDNGILLAPHDIYTIMLELNGASTYCGKIGDTEVEHGDVNITFSKSEKSNNGTSLTEGQIPYLILGIVDSS